MELYEIYSDDFVYEHILDNEENIALLDSFQINKESGKGLENYLKIYALPENELIRHYETFGFSRLSEKDEKFVHSHVKSAYDKDCIFMYQAV